MAHFVSHGSIALSAVVPDSLNKRAIEVLDTGIPGHPYGTQELCYELWEATPGRRSADPARLADALDRVLRSEHAHFSLVWDRASAIQRRVLQALADEPGRPLSGDYQRRHQLPATSSVQKALRTLEREELVARVAGQVRIVEPFLAEWIRRNAE